MLTTPHATTGIAIGSLTGNPFIVVPLALASHFVLDAIPHWQETLAPYTPTWKTYVRVPIDICLAIGLTTLACRWQPQHVSSIWLGAIMANIPDLDSAVVLVPKLKMGVVRKYWDWHCRIQRETSSLWGLVPQVIVVALGLLIANRV